MEKIESFSEFRLSDPILRSVEKSDFKTPTDIQKRVIPLALEGKDLIVEAQTGSGKTACFVLPLLELISRSNRKQNPGIKALVLTPTRELALQISGAFYRLGECIENKVSVLTVIGGESIAQQTLVIGSGVEIIVATPGRLLDLIAQKIISLKDIEYLVLDEADKILDIGFSAELDLVLSEIGEKRQNMFFSATFPEKVLSLVSRISTNPISIKIEDTLPVVDKINQRVISVNREKRGVLLRFLIKKENWHNALVFVGSKTAAHNLSLKLKKAGINACALHGDLSQPERNKALADFKEKKIDFLVATDIAARGIDIQKLNLVVNFDLPRSPADYIHRIGRTARAGEFGFAVSFVGLEDQDHFKLIEKRAQINLGREDIEGFILEGVAIEKKSGQLPVKGKRKSKKDKARELKSSNSSLS